MPLLSMSAADWIRIKRVQGGSRYENEKDSDIINVVSPRGDPFSPPRNISRVVGSSKTRREASKFIDYVASQRQDFTLKSEVSVSRVPQLRLTSICTCTTNVHSPRLTGCLKCNPAQHLRM